MAQQAINYTPGRLYPIALLDDDWLLYQPGTLPDGGLAIIGKLPQSGRPREPGPYPVDPLVGLFFSADGHYLRHEFLPIPAMIDPEWKNSQQINFSRGHTADARTRWAGGIGLKYGTIEVLHFSLPELRIGIADWPRHLFRERLEAGSDSDLLAELNEDERHQDWTEGGFYVLFGATTSG